MNQPLLSGFLSLDNSLAQSEDERNAVVDVAVDTEHCGMEPVLRVQVRLCRRVICVFVCAS
jgi:hypothetical protein